MFYGHVKVEIFLIEVGKSMLKLVLGHLRLDLRGLPGFSMVTRLLIEGNTHC
jgi:hypothetical protein